MPVDCSASACLELYLVTREAEGLEPKTLGGYRAAIQKFFTTPGLPLDDIRQWDVIHATRWLAEMRRDGLSQGGINSYQRPVWTWFRWLFDQGLIERDLSRLVKRVRVADPKRRTLPLAGFEDMLKVAADRSEFAYRNVAILETLWATGLRRAELCALNLEDYDRSEGTLTVRRKGGKVGVLGIGIHARKAIQSYLVHERPKVPGALFLARRDRRMSGNGVLQLIRSIAEGAKVDEAGVHDFRRACAANMLRAGVAADNVARQLGHATLTMTLIYGEEGRTERALDAYKDFDSGSKEMRKPTPTVTGRRKRKRDQERRAG